MLHHGHQETQGQAREIEQQNYEERADAQEAYERVTPPPEIYRNRWPHTDAKVFSILRAEVTRWRLWAGHEYNADAWLTQSRTFTDQQRAWLADAAGRLEALMAEMNQQTQERS